MRGNRRSTNILFIIFGIFFAGLGVVLFIHDASFILTGKTVDLNSILENGEDLPIDSYVTYSCTAPLGHYASSKEYIDNLIPVPFSDTEEYAILLENGLVISTELKNKNTIAAMESFYGGENAEPIVITGCFNTIDPDTKNLMNDYFEGFDCTEAGIALTSYCIDATKTRLSQGGLCVLCVLLGLLIAAAAVRKLIS